MLRLRSFAASTCRIARRADRCRALHSAASRRPRVLRGRAPRTTVARRARDRWRVFGALAAVSLLLASGVRGGGRVAGAAVFGARARGARLRVRMIERRASDWERLTVAGDRVIVERVAAGAAERREFNRHWLRVEASTRRLRARAAAVRCAAAASDGNSATRCRPRRARQSPGSEALRRCAARRARRAHRDVRSTHSATVRHRGQHGSQATGAGTRPRSALADRALARGRARGRDWPAATLEWNFQPPVTPIARADRSTCTSTSSGSASSSSSACSA